MPNGANGLFSLTLIRIVPYSLSHMSHTECISLSPQILPPEGVQELLPEPELVLRAAVPRLQGERRRVLLPRRRQERPGRRDLRRLIIALMSTPIPP